MIQYQDKTNKKWFEDEELYKNIKKDDYDKIYCSGIHKTLFENKEYTKLELLPFNFYMDMNISTFIFWEYNILQQLNFNFTKDLSPFVFVHSKNSNRGVFSKHELNSLENIDNYFIIDPNFNHYDQSDEKNFKKAQQFINLSFFDYIPFLLNADKIFLTNSSFFCLSLKLH